MENQLQILQSYLKRLRGVSGGRPLQHLVCRDGFTMSVQVGDGLYCTPRNSVGPWSAVEIGYPSQVEPLLWPYAELPGRWTDTVYPYTPIEVAAAVCELHGGIDEVAMTEYVSV